LPPSILATPADTAPTVVIIRGNSASGKSSTAHEVRRRYGRGCSLIEQDYLRRVVLREHGSDATPTFAPAFIMTVAQAALAHGYHLVLEGILHTRQYGEPLRQLIAGHPGPSFVFWLQVSLGETVRRHQHRVEPIAVTPEMMAAWYSPLDLLGVPGEQIIGEDCDLEQTVSTVLHASGLTQAAALTPCPLRCPRCAQKRRPGPA
jgi:predicted kinase